ncbi:uncharacterized protein LOC133782899 [Humulus lupulus]|uniref:uncharacterized protein LOC133782899 n=1 Tax=Humulus lupulus TaxID=3486 RepID=UPI002B415A30|nr:uncharacterized protein LOC133782899 [Humulus lupulus]
MPGALFHAPTVCSLMGSSLSLSKPRSTLSSPPMASSSARIAVVGDVHNDWCLEEDTKALRLLQPDLVLFTGDFGEENVALVQSLANLEFPKAVILGNHDAWYTQRFSGKKKDGVQRQLESLGDAHVAYQCVDFPLVKLSVVGGRPFSCGGEKLFRKKLLSARYGVEDMDRSAKRICKAALSAPEDHLVILLAHNGPTGLGSNLDDICGKDWVYGGGDHGDQDLEKAISLINESSKVSVPLIVFGHMHKELAHRKGLRKMIVIGSDDTIYLNGAVVPRVKTLNDKQATNSSFTKDEVHPSLPESEGTKRAFTIVDILDGRVDKIAESWVSVVGDESTLEEEHVLFKRSN